MHPFIQTVESYLLSVGLNPGSCMTKNHDGSILTFSFKNMDKFNVEIHMMGYLENDIKVVAQIKLLGIPEGDIDFGTALAQCALMGLNVPFHFNLFHDLVSTDEGKRWHRIVLNACITSDICSEGTLRVHLTEMHDVANFVLREFEGKCRFLRLAG